MRWVVHINIYFLAKIWQSWHKLINSKFHEFYFQVYKFLKIPVIPVKKQYFVVQLLLLDIYKCIRKHIDKIKWNLWSRFFNKIWPVANDFKEKKICGKMKCILAQCEANSGNLQQPRKEKVVTSVKEAVEVITIISLLASRPSSTKQPPVFWVLQFHRSIRHPSRSLRGHFFRSNIFECWCWCLFHTGTWIPVHI